MDHFLELTKMERIETMRLALETLAKAKRRPKELGDIIRKAREIAGIYAAYIIQEKKAEQPTAPKDFISQNQCSEDLIRSLYAKA